MREKRRTRAALLAAVGLLAQPAAADTCNRTDTGNWTESGEWSCNDVPDCDDHAVIVDHYVTQDFDGLEVLSLKMKSTGNNSVALILADNDGISIIPVNSANPEEGMLRMEGDVRLTPSGGNREVVAKYIYIFGEIDTVISGPAANGEIRTEDMEDHECPIR